MIKRVIEAAIEPFMGVLSELVTDKDELARLKKELTESLIQQETKFVEASASVVLAEAKGSWMQRNWRPGLMWTYIAIIFNNYILFPYGATLGFDVSMLEFPPDFWTMMNICVGGYVVGRTVEKTGSTMRVGGLTQNQKADLNG